MQIVCSKDIIGHGFGKDFSVNICFVDFLPKYFLVGVSFENCFVKISLQGVCGRNDSSNTFSVGITAENCLA